MNLILGKTPNICSSATISHTIRFLANVLDKFHILRFKEVQYSLIQKMYHNTFSVGFLNSFVFDLMKNS